MIIGIVNLRGDAVVTLPIQTLAGTFTSIEVVVDTGFSDYLLLPSDLVNTLRLPQGQSITVQMADGRQVLVKEYNVAVFWDGEEIVVPVQGGEGEPLIGMALLRAYNLSVDVTENGAVRITKLPLSA